MAPLITLQTISLPAPSEDDRRADEQRIRDALGLEPLEIPLSMLRKLPFREGNEISCIVGRQRHGYRLVDLSARSSYSIALDLGTTNLVASLFDNITQRVVSEIKIENPQTALGSDILTRMQQAMLDREEDLKRKLMEGVNSAIDELCNAAGIEGNAVHALAAAGNTVMSHFFLGLDVSRIPVAPFTPVVRNPGFFRAADLNLNIHPEGPVYLFPNAGSYVGGDIIGGILASGLYESPKTCVLIDVGTNAEIVIGSRDWMLAGAGAAGPALEEGIAAIGRRAEKGIIYDVQISDQNLRCMTFDNAPPEGICGSGMVSLIYELYRAGIIGNNGRLNTDHEWVDMAGGEASFHLSCNHSDGLIIGQREIDNFLRSKGAMFTLLLVLLRSVGLRFSDVEQVYIAGALGSGIDVKKAAGIGMLPDWPAEKIIPVGNGALKGAQMVLENSDLLMLEDRILESITYKHMHDDPEFMKEFSGALFIPHTNPELLKI